MLKTLFKHKSWNTAILFAIGLLSSVLGFIREIQIASLFGVSNEADFYFMGALIPEMLAGIIGNASANIFMRQYNGEENKKDYAASVMALLFLLAVTSLLLLLLLFPYLTRWISPGLSGDELERFIAVGRIMLGGMLSSVFVGVLTGTLNMNGKFMLAGFNGLLYNSVLIVSTVLLVPHYDINGLAWSYLFANAARVALLYPFAVRYIGAFKLRLSLPLLKELPRISATNLMLSLQVLMERSFANSLGAGAVSILSYTGRITYLPSMLLVTSVLTVAFPKFIHESSEEPEKLDSSIRSTIKFILYTLVAIEIFLILFRQDIVNLLFMRGKFDAESSRLVSGLFLLYAPYVVVSSINQVLLKVAYAMGKTKLPVLAMAISLPAYAVLALALKGTYGIDGLAWSLVGYNMTICISLYIGIRLTTPLLRARTFKSLPLGLALPAGVVYLIFTELVTLQAQHVLELAIIFIVFGLTYTVLLAAADGEVRSFIRQKANAVRLAGRRIEKHRL